VLKASVPACGHVWIHAFNPTQAKPIAERGVIAFHYTSRGIVLCINELTSKRVTAFYTLFTRQLVYSFTNFAYAQNHAAHSITKSNKRFVHKQSKTRPLYKDEHETHPDGLFFRKFPFFQKKILNFSELAYQL
jgi:hypothetical protein